MNCLEFHREKLVDPRRLSASAQIHVQTCASCTAFAHSVDEGERSLERVLATPVPDGLADRVILRARAPSRHWRAWAMAASVVLVLASGVQIFRDAGKAPDQYARLAIEHVVKEPESLTTLRNSEPDAFREVVQRFGGTLKESPGRIRYVRLCPLEEGAGWHVVFETPEGLATLILVAGTPLGAAQTASAGGWNSLARPAAGGYYAVVTASEAATLEADRILRARVDWDS